jgi:hypothetical protein
MSKRRNRQQQVGQEAARHMENMSKAALKATAELRKGFMPDASLEVTSRAAAKQAQWGMWAGREILRLADDNPGETKRFVIAMPDQRRCYEITLTDVEKRP